MLDLCDSGDSHNSLRKSSTLCNERGTGYHIGGMGCRNLWLDEKKRRFRVAEQVKIKRGNYSPRGSESRLSWVPWFVISLYLCTTLPANSTKCLLLDFRDTVVNDIVCPFISVRSIIRQTPSRPNVNL